MEQFYNSSDLCLFLGNKTNPMDPRKKKFLCVRRHFQLCPLLVTRDIQMHRSHSAPIKSATSQFQNSPAHEACLRWHSDY